LAKHNLLGINGEAMAVKWLSDRGFILLHQNWRHGRYEIDIIAHKKSVLHFIEVKTRRSQRFGLPEESVDIKKLQKLMKAAEQFLFLFPGWKRIQYDILSIFIGSDNRPDFFFIEDVYL